LPYQRCASSRLAKATITISPTGAVPSLEWPGELHGASSSLEMWRLKIRQQDEDMFVRMLGKRDVITTSYDDPERIARHSRRVVSHDLAYPAGL
jgi:hypothetical protein